jgi:hypothetical protein
MLRSCLRLCLPFGVTASLVALLASGKSQMPQSPSEEGIVWVYSEALCAAPHDASDCRDLRGANPAFATFQACDAYRDDALGRAGNPRLLARCSKEHEA